MSDLLLLLQGLHLLLVADELLLHQQVIFDPLLLQQLQTALGVRGDWEEKHRTVMDVVHNNNSISPSNVQKARSVTE